MAKAKYPRVIFVKQEREKDGSDYLLAHKTSSEVAQVGSTVTVAQYKFDRIVKVSAYPVVE